MLNLTLPKLNTGYIFYKDPDITNGYGDIVYVYSYHCTWCGDPLMGGGIGYVYIDHKNKSVYITDKVLDYDNKYGYILDHNRKTTKKFPSEGPSKYKYAAYNLDGYVAIEHEFCQFYGFASGYLNKEYTVNIVNATTIGVFVGWVNYFAKCLNYKPEASSVAQIVKKK